MKVSVGCRKHLLLSRRPPRRQLPEGSTSYEAAWTTGPTVPPPAPLPGMPAVQLSVLSQNTVLPFHSSALSPKTWNRSIRKALWARRPDRGPRAPQLNRQVPVSVHSVWSTPTFCLSLQLGLPTQSVLADPLRSDPTMRSLAQSCQPLPGLQALPVLHSTTLSQPLTLPQLRLLLCGADTTSAIMRMKWAMCAKCPGPDSNSRKQRSCPPQPLCPRPCVTALTLSPRPGTATSRAGPPDSRRPHPSRKDG